MEQHITYDDNVARLAASHPALFERGIPEDSDLKAGWYSLVDELCTDIERELAPELAKRFSVDQIKEKFGTLRFYWRLGDRGDLHVDIFTPGGTALSSLVKAKPSRAADAEIINQARDRLRELVDTACEASASVCQRCGAFGSIRRLAWVQTLCDEHFVEIEKRYAKEAQKHPASDESDESEEGDE